MCAIAGLVFGFIGLNMSKRDLAMMDAGTMDPTGRSNTSAGRVCSIIGLILSAISCLLLVLYLIFFILLAGAAAVSGAGANP